MLLNLSLAMTGADSSANEVNPFVVLRIVPLDGFPGVGDIRTETIRLSALRAGWLVSVDDASYRVEVLLPDGARLTSEVRKDLSSEGEREISVELNYGLPRYTLDHYEPLRYRPLLSPPAGAPTGENRLPGTPSTAITSYLASYTPPDSDKGRVALRFKEGGDGLSFLYGRMSVESWRGHVAAVRRPARREAVGRKLFEGPALEEPELVKWLFGRSTGGGPFDIHRGESDAFPRAVEGAAESTASNSAYFSDWSHEPVRDSRAPSALRQSTISVRTGDKSLYLPITTDRYWHAGFGQIDALILDLTFEADATDIVQSLSGQSMTALVQARDPLLGSVLGFLQAGEVRAARDVLKTASDMLYHKFVNPWAAAAGAHVLLGAYSSNGDAEWHGWVENLTDYFPRITDGRIVLAALVLRRARGLQRYGNSDGVEPVAQAKELCMRALSYGVPLFSASVRLLLENVSLVAGLEADVSEDEKDKTRRLLGYVHWLASRVDPYQPFAVWTITHSGF